MHLSLRFKNSLVETNWGGFTLASCFLALIKEQFYGWEDLWWWEGWTSSVGFIPTLCVNVLCHYSYKKGTLDTQQTPTWIVLDLQSIALLCCLVFNLITVEISDQITNYKLSHYAKIDLVIRDFYQISPGWDLYHVLQCCQLTKLLPQYIWHQRIYSIIWSSSVLQDLSRLVSINFVTYLMIYI